MRNVQPEERPDRLGDPPANVQLGRYFDGEPGKHEFAQWTNRRPGQWPESRPQFGIAGRWSALGTVGVAGQQQLQRHERLVGKLVRWDERLQRERPVLAKCVVELRTISKS